MVAGLEVHQQLDTQEKLFCRCPTTLREADEAEREFERYLHPTKSELGEIDEAALEESMVDRVFRYLAYDSTCLVEEDDEPPQPIDREALEIALEVAELLEMRRVDQAHVMRKIVIDGSNTTGFQRSALVATDGVVETSEGDVRVDSMSVEEESAQRVDDESGEGVDVYSLDRLGIPLVEIGTMPDIRSPEQAQEAAEEIGMLLRSTGRVKRGLGTIRQDLNVSIEEGARIEMKGVQSLDMIGELVRKEVRRQKELVEIRDELRERDASVGEPRDVSGVFRDTDSGIIASALEDGGVVMAVLLEGFEGLVGREIQPDRRLGTEFSDRAKKRGAGGVFHTDELPAYGITESEVEALREAVDAGDRDAVALVADYPDVAESAIKAVVERAREALEGVPEETRDANHDGTSSYLRPLPGAARMYPETDVYPVELGEIEVEEPELLTERAARYEEDHGLDDGLARQVAYGEYMPVYEDAVEGGVDPTFAAATLESTLTELRRDDVSIGEVTDQQLLDALSAVEDGDLTKEAVPDVLRYLSSNPDASIGVAVEEVGADTVDRGDVREVVLDVLDEKEGLVEEEGMGAFSGLMGVVMGELRGKADGEVVSEVLREELQERV